MLISILLLIALFIVAMVLLGIKIVQQSETVVIERLGKYHCTLPSGINIIWPIIDRPRSLDWRIKQMLPSGKEILMKSHVSRIDLREQVYDFPRQSVITKDNVLISINAMLYFQITAPVKAVYEIANLPEAIEKLTQTTLRNVIGEMDLDETLSSRDTVNRKLRSILDEATDKWGVKVNRVELQDILPPKDIQLAMEKQMRAERDRRAKVLEAEGAKRAAILEAEGYKEARISKAQGEKEARILAADADAMARTKVAQAEAEAIAKISGSLGANGGDPANYLISIKYVDSLKEMVSGQGNKVVYMPYEATGVLGSVGGIKEMFKSAIKPEA